MRMRILLINVKFIFCKIIKTFSKFNIKSMYLYRFPKFIDAYTWHYVTFHYVRRLRSKDQLTENAKIA